VNTWFRETPESLRYLAEERAVIEAAELIEDRLEARGVKRSDLAEILNVGRSEITQRLSGKRNLSVKSLAAMLHSLGYRLRIEAEDLDTGQRHTSRAIPLQAAPAQIRHEARYTPTGNTLRIIPGTAA
jgi:transcriptional regulator with XRE-family HTH domain